MKNLRLISSEDLFLESTMVFSPKRKNLRLIPSEELFLFCFFFRELHDFFTNIKKSDTDSKRRKKDFRVGVGLKKNILIRGKNRSKITITPQPWWQVKFYHIVTNHELTKAMFQRNNLSEICRKIFFYFFAFTFYIICLIYF